MVRESVSFIPARTSLESWMRSDPWQFEKRLVIHGSWTESAPMLSWPASILLAWRLRSASRTWPLLSRMVMVALLMVSEAGRRIRGDFDAPSRRNGDVEAFGARWAYVGRSMVPRTPSSERSCQTSISRCQKKCRQAKLALAVPISSIEEVPASEVWLRRASRT